MGASSLQCVLHTLLILFPGGDLLVVFGDENSMKRVIIKLYPSSYYSVEIFPSAYFSDTLIYIYIYIYPV
jgi:hypothetical protein